MLKFASLMLNFATKMLKFASLMLKFASLMLKLASKKKYNEKFECVQIKIHKSNFLTHYSVNLLNPNKIQTKGNNLRDILIKKIKKIKSLFIFLFNRPDPLYKYFSYCYKTYTLCVYSYNVRYLCVDDRKPFIKNIFIIAVLLLQAMTS